MKRLKSLILAAAVGLAAAAQEAPRYIFYFIGDGMGHGQVMSADVYRRLVLKEQDPILMFQFPVASMATTWSANSPVTDSAAAGTALATGSKTRNGMLGMNADTVDVRSVAMDLAEQGYGIGLVTNVCPDDATPGAFYAHVPYRGHVYDIAVQAAKSPVKFLAGSKLRGVMRDGKYTGIYETLAENGMQTVRGVANLPGIDSERILLLSTDTIRENMGHAIDGTKPDNLYNFTEAAIKHLQRTSPDRFFLMVEGGNIDWAGHDNDGCTIAREVLYYNDVLRQAYDFYLAHPTETLIIVTADHETGGMTIGRESTHYAQYPGYVDRQHISKREFGALCQEILRHNTPISWEEMQQILGEKMGFYSATKISEANDTRLKQAFERTFVKHNDEATTNLYNSYREFTETVFAIQNEMDGYGFTSGSHTGNPVPVFAIGVGAELFGRPLDNTQIPAIIRSLTKK